MLLEMQQFRNAHLMISDGISSHTLMIHKVDLSHPPTLGVGLLPIHYPVRPAATSPVLERLVDGHIEGLRERCHPAWDDDDIGVGLMMTLVLV